MKGNNTSLIIAGIVGVAVIGGVAFFAMNKNKAGTTGGDNTANQALLADARAREAEAAARQREAELAASIRKKELEAADKSLLDRGIESLFDAGKTFLQGYAGGTIKL